ncbi:MAG: hypothetical protein EOO75_19060 [Myxococcales bacterium]|nr:MAG: hypothetical protein EOO75_19060 [Myxococcales bacterium]
MRPAVLVDAGSPGPDDPPETAAPSFVPTTGTEPLFAGATVRRASVSPSLRLDLSGCVGGERCLAQSVRGGLLMGDLVELSGGVRFEQNGVRTAWLGVIGLALQGRFTGAPWMSLVLGHQMAVAGDSLRLTPNAGLRFEPVRGTVVGVMPLGLTYFQEKERVAYTPSLDLAHAF